MTRSKRRQPKKSEPAQWVSRDELEMSNERFQNYYKAQEIIPEDQWDSFMNALRQPLPSTFRITGNRLLAQALKRSITESHIPQLEATTFEGEPLPVPTAIPWYPGGLAWQLSVPRKSLRKSAEYKRFHNFLVYETEVGNISRQETVSMLPPLFLDVQPHHWVIDMCAAPGSKTAQIIEAFHANDGSTNASTPTGFLIANDSDLKRAHLLVHQSSRLPSPALMVTNFDASIYPNIKIPSNLFPTASTSSNGDSKDAGTSESGSNVPRSALFDRILCDVPCSGDGTIRKNLGIWRSWQPMDGNGLHSLQLRILQRAMRMIKPYGRIVYSTCSLNPVENEAVIAAALNTSPGFELVDVSDSLETLIRRPGISHWKPAVNRDGDVSFGSYADYLESLKNGTGKSKLTVTHWPPDNVKELNLERCLRVYPHLQNTGGFFIAVLQRTSTEVLLSRREAKRSAPGTPTPASSKKTKVATPETEESIEQAEVPEASSLQPEDVDMETPQVDDSIVDEESTTVAFQATKESKSNDAGGGTFKEHPYTFILPDEPMLRACLERLELKESFPSSNLYVRNPAGEPVRSLYLVNEVVKAIIENNEYTRIRLVSAGVKVFGRSEGSKNAEGVREGHQFRALNEGLLAVLPYVREETLLEGKITALKQLLETYYPLTAGFEDDFRTMLDSKPFGSYIVRFQTEGKGYTSDIFLPLWKSEVSLSLMVDKKAKSALSLRLFGEDVTPEGKKSTS